MAFLAMVCRFSKSRRWKMLAKCCKYLQKHQLVKNKSLNRDIKKVHGKMAEREPTKVVKVQ